MSVDFNRVLVGAYERTFAPTGRRFVVAFFLLSLFDALLVADLDNFVPTGNLGPAVTFGPGAGEPTGPYLDLGLPAAADALLLVVGVVASLVVGIAAIRTFVAGATERVPREYVTRNLLFASLNLLVGGFLFGLAVAVGLVLFVVPGLFLLVSLFFWEVFVVVEDDSFVGGFERSWALTSGRRLTLFLLGVVVALVTFLVGLLFAVPAELVGGPVGLLVEEVGGAITTVYVVASVAETYTQLRDDGDHEGAEGAPADGGTGDPGAADAAAAQAEAP